MLLPSHGLIGGRRACGRSKSRLRTVPGL